MTEPPDWKSRSSVVFLSPHNDDETLFGAFTLLRERPRVIVLLRSYVQQERGTGVTYQEREAETSAALEVLGIEDWEQWPYPDAAPPWDEVRDRLASIDADRIYAPAVEQRGHQHHNTIGQIAQMLWPERVTPYTTYTSRGRTTKGQEVPWEHEWVLLKLQALACYRSQIVIPDTRTTSHFLTPQFEYYAVQSRPLRAISDQVNRIAHRYHSRSSTRARFAAGARSIVQTTDASGNPRLDDSQANVSFLDGEKRR